MSEERDYHLEKKDLIPFVGWFKYHGLGVRFLAEGKFKDALYHFPRELGLVAYNTLLLGTALIAEAGLEQLVK